MAMTKVKNLQLWCKKMADGYRDVEVRDMAASWKSGLAFCAIIHRFRPDLIDYDSLAKENVFENNNLAFEVAEKELSIPAFLEAADMVAIRVPDKLSVVTYVSQYYNYFHNKPQLGGPGVNKFVSPSKRKDNRPPAILTESTSSLTPTQKKGGNTEIQKDRQESIGDKCSICHEKVYLMERHIENGRLYHRRCFRNSDASPQSKVFKRQPYNPILEQNESQSTKYRKLDSDLKKDNKEKFDSKPDFLKKYSEGKSSTTDLPVSDKKFDFNAKSHVGLSDIPSLKTVDKSKDVKSGAASAFSKTDPKDKFGATARKADEPKPQTGNLVNKFKELNERNLKALNESSASKSNEQNKLSEKSKEQGKQFPVPKPRHNVGKAFERMDTSEKKVHPSPVKNKWDASSSSSSVSPKLDDVKSKIPHETKKADFSRPKTPPNSYQSELSFNILKEKKASSSSPPPPLPASSPPRIPISQPPTLPASQHTKLDFDRSPVSSPRLDTKKAVVNSPKARDKFNKAETTVLPRPHPAPAKPPRVSEINERSASPMDTSEQPVLSTAVIHDPSIAQSAVLVVPKRHDPDEEQKNREVLGGLLKSLADIRSKHDVKHGNSSGDNKGLDFSSSALRGNKTDVKIDLRSKDINECNKFKDKNESNKSGETHFKPRPKTSYVSQNRDLFSNTSKSKDESRGKSKVVSTTKTVVTTTTTTKTTTTTSSDQKSKDINKVVEKTKVTMSTDDKIKMDSDIPEWKRKLEEKKHEKARPKSADLLSDKTGGSSAGLLDWQKEAVKRKEARKGGYDDPEKVKVADRNTNNIIDSVRHTRPLSPPKRNADDTVNQITHKYRNGYKEEKVNREKSKSPEKAKINVDQIKTKAKDKVPELKPLETNKKKILFENSATATDKTQADATKKKIGLGQKFVFEDVELKPTPKKPPRPAEQPTSPRSLLTPPSRPPPPKTSPMSVTKHHLSTYQIQKQLRLIDEKLTELELKGRTLEDSIRNVSEEEEDELMINWFELVNDKNELVRRECDLVYISRQQELEIEQDKIEQQLRKLVDKPDHLKTEADKEKEMQLLEKKVDVVYQRNSIVDSIDEDRLRYLAEDRDIEAMLQNKGFLKDSKDAKQKKKDKR